MLKLKRSMLKSTDDVTRQMFLNTGTQYDLATGAFLPGKNGKYILNGGLSSINSFAGKEQTFKTSISLGLSGKVLRNYPFLESLVWDTENSLGQEERIAALAGCKTPDEISEFVKRVEYRNLDSYFLEDFHERIMEIVAERNKYRKDLTEETPFLDRNGKFIKAWVPIVIVCDSFSGAPVRLATQLVDKEGLSGAKSTTDNMKSGLIKTRFFSQLPYLAAKGGIIFVFTAHIQKDGGMSTNPADRFKKQLPSMKINESLRNVGTKFTYYSNNMAETRTVKALINKVDKGCEYPFEINTPMELQQIKSIICRCKNNLSGTIVEHISSQYYGIQEHLEHFNYIRNHSKLFGTSPGRFTVPGMEKAVSRKTVRNRINESYEFRRMLEIIGQYLYIHNHWNFSQFNMIQPEQFIEMITNTSKGMIEDITNSTGIWTFNSAKQDRKYMSIIDILNIISTKS